MADTLYFPLTKDLVLPATGNPYKGKLLFETGVFSLSYEIRPNAQQKVLSITLQVVETETKEVVWPISTIEIKDTLDPDGTGKTGRYKYVEAVGKFGGDGLLSEPALDWFKKLPIGDKKVGQYI